MKTEIGLGIAGAAALAGFLWMAFALAAEPFYSGVAVFLAGFWGAVSGCGFWAAMNRWEERHAAGQWPRPTVIMPNRRRP